MRTLLSFLPSEPRIPFVRLRWAALALSGVLLVASAGEFMVRGLNYGIDFRGGTLIEVGAPGPADIADLRQRIGSLGLGDVQIQQFGNPEDVLIRVEEQVGEDSMASNLKAVEVIRATLGEEMDYRRVEVVGPKVSGELIRSGMIAVGIAVILVLIYIWFRFEWQFSVGAVLALVHDVVLTIGIFSALQLEFNLSIIAAILTIVGYSLNDTVVIYDRIRENLRKFKKMPLPELADLSINQTLMRTLMTSVTTLLALSSLYIFGGEVLRGFTFAMIWGVFIGTYSSVYIASPLLLSLGVKRDWSAAGA